VKKGEKTMNFVRGHHTFVALAAAIATLTLLSASAFAGRGPSTPNFNLEAQLRPVTGAEDGFGLVKFRQPKDGDMIVFLDVWVRDLVPTRQYYLQRATDTQVDDYCAGVNWLTLGEGPDSKAISTDQSGTGRTDLFRALPASSLGTEFDIHFRVIDVLTSAVVLESDCYQFTVSL
jgi:hypothetical protein